jgi:hypothetical protein
MRVLGAVLVAAMASASGCTSVKMVQREGCWVERTEKWPKRVQEKIGPCARERGPWSDDRLVRLVQECVAAADHRWEGRALVAWSRKEPLPERPDDQSVLQACLTQSAQAVVTDNETLRQRLAEVSEDRDALRTRGDKEQQHLLATHDKLATFLGEAAKKASPPATATAYAASDGKARTDTMGTPAAAPATIALFANGLPANACPPGVAASPVAAGPPFAVPPEIAAAAAPPAPVLEATDPAPATAKEPTRRARAPRPVKNRDVPATAPAAPDCESCPPPGAPPAVTDGNGAVTPTVAPANRDDSTSR